MTKIPGAETNGPQLGADPHTNLMALTAALNQAAAGGQCVLAIPPAAHLEELIALLPAVAPLESLTCAVPTGSYHAYCTFLALADRVLAGADGRAAGGAADVAANGAAPAAVTIEAADATNDAASAAAANTATGAAANATSATAPNTATGAAAEPESGDAALLSEKTAAPTQTSGTAPRPAVAPDCPAAATRAVFAAGNATRLTNQYLAGAAGRARRLSGLAARGLAAFDIYQPLKAQLLGADYAAATLTIVATASLFSGRRAAPTDTNLLIASPRDLDPLAPWRTAMHGAIHPVRLTAAPGTSAATGAELATPQSRRTLWLAQHPDRVTAGVVVGDVAYTVYEFAARGLVIYDAPSSPRDFHVFFHHRPDLILTRARRAGRVANLYKTTVPHDHTITSQAALEKFVNHLFRPQDTD